MGLVVQKTGALYGGVNQQSPEHRLSSQVKEMVNCIPTVDQGLRLRNSSAPIPVYDLDGVLSEVTFPEITETAFVYEYDRGIIGDRSSELAFIITEEGGLEIIDLTLRQETNGEGQEILAGTIYKDGNGITYEDDNARAYIGYIGERPSFAMATIKDTTFVINKTVQPVMLPTVEDGDDIDDGDDGDDGGGGEIPDYYEGDVTMDYKLVTGLNMETVTGEEGVFKFTVPDNVSQVTVCMVGGGGSGAVYANRDACDGKDFLGGYAGKEINTTYTVVAGTEVDVIVGVGGKGKDADWGEARGGNAGTLSSFSDLVADGGLGAGNPTSNDSSGHRGKGELGVTGCGDNNIPHKDGTARAGSLNNYCPIYGGQASSFGNGSDARVRSENGGIGAGSGASGDDSIEGGSSTESGSGGYGRVIVKWAYDTPASIATTKFYRSEGYVWIKRIDVVDGYKYGCTFDIKAVNGDVATIDVVLSDKVPDDSTLAASTLADNIIVAIGARGTATSEGSIVQIKLTDPDEEIISVDSFDTFGDLASFGWAHTVTYQSDLPQNMAGYKPIVRVGEPREPAYWLQYKDNQWKEYRDPDILTQINPSTMPYTIERFLNGNTNRYEFRVVAYDWNSRQVGDDKTNKLPSFINPSDGIVPYLIKDIFFFRNRLGFITQTSIIMSETGEYGNFFRTSVAAVLASDRIDTTVESANAVNLEYSILLEDSVILFADKAQFRFKGGDILSSTDYSINQELAYDVNIDVRPLFMNDRIFFVSKRGNHSAIYEMRISDNSGQSSSAIDISAHCQTYIDGAIEKLTGSPVDNTLFLTSKVSYERTGKEDEPIATARNKIFVYRYLDDGNKRIQSAWTTWTVNGDILSGFALSRNFYMLINRANAILAMDWVMGSGQWDMNEVWRMDGQWVMTPESLDNFKQFERIPVHPKAEDLLFLDNFDTKIEGEVNLGEFVYGSDNKKRLDGEFLLKTLQVRTSDDSHLLMYVTDKQRNSYREVISKYLIGRKPMIYGNSRNIEVGFKNSGDRGFRLDDIVYEANRLRRNQTK